MLLIATNIQWDTDGMRPLEDCNLPESIVIVDVPNQPLQDLDELISKVVDVYGFRVTYLDMEEFFPDRRGGRNKLSVMSVMKYRC